MITISIGKVVAIALNSFSLGMSLVNLVWTLIFAIDLNRDIKKLQGDSAKKERKQKARKRDKKA